MALNILFRYHNSMARTTISLHSGSLTVSRMLATARPNMSDAVVGLWPWQPQSITWRMEDTFVIQRFAKEGSHSWWKKTFG